MFPSLHETSQSNKDTKTVRLKQNTHSNHNMHIPLQPIVFEITFEHSVYLLAAKHCRNLK